MTVSFVAPYKYFHPFWPYSCSPYISVISYYLSPTAIGVCFSYGGGACTWKHTEASAECRVWQGQGSQARRRVFTTKECIEKKIQFMVKNVWLKMVRVCVNVISYYKFTPSAHLQCVLLCQGRAFWSRTHCSRCKVLVLLSSCGWDPLAGVCIPCCSGTPTISTSKEKTQSLPPCFYCISACVFFFLVFFSSRGLQGGRVNLRSSKWLKGKIIKALVRCRHMTPVRRLYA